MGRFYNWFRMICPVTEPRVIASDDLKKAKHDLLMSEATIENEECERMKLQKRIARLEEYLK